MIQKGTNKLFYSQITMASYAILMRVIPKWVFRTCENDVEKAISIAATYFMESTLWGLDLFWIPTIAAVPAGYIGAQFENPGDGGSKMVSAIGATWLLTHAITKVVCPILVLTRTIGRYQRGLSFIRLTK